MKGVTLGVTEVLSDAGVGLIEREVVDYNVARSIPYDRRPLCIFARDAENRAVGSATGHTDWGVLEDYTTSDRQVWLLKHLTG